MPRPRSLKTKLRKDEFYCVRCRARRKGFDIKFKNVKNYKRGTVPMMKGFCQKCETKVNKFVKKF